MQNFDLLKELGRLRHPILLKRGLSATIEEWLLSAEYILAGGNTQVILCERGIRTFEVATRNTLDISAIPVIKKLSHLPILVDPSHGTGRRDKVLPMGRAGIAAGADGLLIEVHNDPEKALSDGAQSLYPEQFDRLMASCASSLPSSAAHFLFHACERRGDAGHRGPRPHQELSRRPGRRRQPELPCGAREVLRLPGSQRRGEEHHDQDAHRSPAPHLGATR